MLSLHIHQKILTVITVTYSVTNTPDTPKNTYVTYNCTKILGYLKYDYFSLGIYFCSFIPGIMSRGVSILFMWLRKYL